MCVNYLRERKRKKERVLSIFEYSQWRNGDSICSEFIEGRIPIFRWRNKVGPAVAYSAIYSFPFPRFLPAIVDDD